MPCQCLLRLTEFELPNSLQHVRYAANQLEPLLTELEDACFQRLVSSTCDSYLREHCYTRVEEERKGEKMLVINAFTINGIELLTSARIL